MNFLIEYLVIIIVSVIFLRFLLEKFNIFVLDYGIHWQCTLRSINIISVLVHVIVE